MVSVYLPQVMNSAVLALSWPRHQMDGFDQHMYVGEHMKFLKLYNYIKVRYDLIKVKIISLPYILIQPYIWAYIFLFSK